MKNLKRVLSLMMAVLLCFGLFPGSALAAENDYDGYLAMIEYKDRRYSLSENLPAPFGGRTTEEFFELRINDLRTYRTAYCIQMGVRANSGIGYESSDDYVSFTEEQKALINTTLTLGYNMETGTKYGGSAIDEYIATQILIWLIAHNQLGTGYESQIVDEITANSPAAKPIFYTLRENVMNYRTIPSFTTDDPSAVGAYTHALQYNESTGKNETTLVDENNVLGDFTFSCPGVDFSVDGNQLHISTSETDFGTITAEKSLPSSIPGVVTGGTKYWLRDTYQNVVTFDVEGEAQPVECYFSLEIRSGALQIVKTSEDGEVSGIPFHISGNGVERDVVTGPDGTIGVDNLQAGTYTITEQSKGGWLLARVDGDAEGKVPYRATAEIAFVNEKQTATGSLVVTKELAGELDADDADTVFNFMLMLDDNTITTADAEEYGVQFENGIASFSLKGGESITIANLPAGVGYTIAEVRQTGWTLQSVSGADTGVVPKNDTAEIVFTNLKNGTDIPDVPVVPTEPEEPTEPESPKTPETPEEPAEPDAPAQDETPGEEPAQDDTTVPAQPAETPAQDTTKADTLPQTGTTGWLAVVLMSFGFGLLACGWFFTRKQRAAKH